MILGFLMSLVPGTVVYAAQQKGSVELHLPAEETGIEMMLVPVAEYKDGTYLLREAFAGSSIEISNLNDEEIAQKGAAELADFVRENGIPGTEGKAGEDGTIRFDGLDPALYLAMQSKGAETCTVQAALVPVPYMGSDGTEIYDAVITPKYSFPGGAVILDKVDDDGNVVGQVSFTLQEKEYITEDTEVPQGAEVLTDEGGSYFWKEFAASLETDENGQIVVTDMPIGDYRFLEVAAPEGLIMSTEPIGFSITQAGQAAKVNGVYASSTGKAEILTVVNEQTSVRINKVDKNGKPVPGAKLVVKSADGKVMRSADDEVLFSFTSAEEPYELKRIPAGTYLLSEVEAPAGYKVSADVPFTIDGSAGAVNEVTMVDVPEEVTKASLKVTKDLVDEFEQTLMADDAVFYVALFEDAERTKRVSSVQAVHYQGTERETVTFENLEVDKTYYVGETDEFGELLDGMQYGDGVFAPDYPKSYEIRPTKREPEHEFSFENMFYELPDGYYYGGRLTVTKKVLKGTEDYETDEVFYAAIFTDAAYTERYGDVIALEMDGSSEVSETREVFIGENASDSMTYYVAETDEDGNVLDPDSGMEFSVSVDTAKVTLSPESSEAEVVITNTFEEEPDVTPEASATPEPDEPSGTTGTPGSGSGSSPVKTGDDTPVGMFIAVLIGAAAVAMAAMAYRKKKR